MQARKGERVSGRGFYEFFAGGGMARAGLGPDWRCLYANDFDAKKATVYRANWGEGEMHACDVWAVAPFELPGRADLAWASFPCQDLSLAGTGAGLAGERSGAFHGFWRLIQALRRERHAPTVVVLENVCGLLTSHGGRDFLELCRALGTGGYRFGALVIDAIDFVPQSRPRLFVIGLRDDIVPPAGPAAARSNPRWHPKALRDAYGELGDVLALRWLWFDPPVPASRNVTLIDLLEDAPADVAWHTDAETERLLGMMSPVNAAKVRSAARSGERMAGAIYKRTRIEDGAKVQRAEVRFDGVSGCLRTPGGGSSRQVLMIVEAGAVRSRLISARETARLMGLPEEYRLPAKYNEAYHLTGDGVAVPVVRFLAEHVIEPLIDECASAVRAAA